ncbi:YdaS family helix-turn-helix protein [Glaciimonas sp. PCH181]|uniref:transcriptional regulator n=1 Tax=Glaciimonas sp. PCH181 TaxID=2133943 RepID=UPI000D3C7BB8|nr:YdaS family helix-turn-helix protein [Glaciimonas sp. PCH181]PUA17296.1 hypothetical protein C7W93_15315 [Glaciimonas sp. PCH181]
MDKLLKYLNGLSKGDRTQFVRACGTSEGYLRKAISISQQIGLDLCINLERESNRAIVCEDLRPDVDWEYLRSTAVKSNLDPMATKGIEEETNEENRREADLGYRQPADPKKVVE